MTTLSFAREEWKPVHLGEGFTNDFRLEISDFGRVRAFNRLNKGRLLKGSMINGYRIVRLKMFNPRTPESEELIKTLKDDLSRRIKEIGAMRIRLKAKKTPADIKTTLAKQLEVALSELAEKKKAYIAVYGEEMKKRTVYIAPLVHRMVAENFLKPPSPEHTIVAHLDFDKLNNAVTNLRWMTHEENKKHQQLSPLVQADRNKKKQTHLYGSKTAKLTVTKVMYLKKLLNEGVHPKTLAKQFKVTETQIIRIKNNINWASVEPAK